MNQEKKLPGAELWGVEVIVDKSMTKESRKVLFPEHLEYMNKLISQIVNLDEILDRKK